MTKRKRAPDAPCRCDGCRTNAMVLGMAAVARDHASGYLGVVTAALRVAMIAAGIDPFGADAMEARLLAVLLPDLTVEPGEAIH